MSFFIDTIRKRVGDIFFQRGKKYFKEGFATIKETKPTENGMIFRGVVRGSTDYETSILVEFFPKKKLKFFCSCPAFDDHSGRCKHIAALALSIEKEYIIDDQNQQIIKKSDTVVDMSGSDTTGSIEEMLVTALKNNLNVSPDRFLEYLTSHGYDIEDIMSLLHKERNNIGGVSSPSVKTPHILKLLETPSTLMTEERHYRFKLDFSGGKNLYLSLYECKVLKNGSLSSGRELSQVDGRHMRGEYKKYIPFLEGRGYYYNSWERISFRDASDFFVQTLHGIESLTNTQSNQPIVGYRDDCRLKIETEKTSEGTYAFIGTLLSDSFDPICTKGLSCLTSAIGEPWYAVPIISQNILLFFRSTLPQAFIKALFHGDITLSREEKDILVASPSFERLASTLASVEPLGIVPETLRPFLLFRLMIPDSFDRIECEGFFDYQGILVSSQDTRPLLRLMDGRWVRRSTEEEDAVTMGDTMVRDFIGSFDEMRDESILIKHTDDTIDGFFDRVDRMVADGHARFEYLQDTKRFVTTPVQVKVSVKSGIDWFDLSTEISVGDDVLAEGKNIVASIRKGKKFVLLSDGTALMLRESLKNTMDELEELGIDMANIHESQRIDRHMIGAFREQTKDISLVFDLDTKAKELKKAFENFSGIASVPLPIGLQATLREYQITGYHWLHFLYGYGFSGILADDMGLGKTIQTIAFLTKLYEDGAPKAPTLIVCPTSLLFNWVGEFQRFAPAMRVVSLASSKTDWNDIPGDTQVIVVSYTVLSLLTERLLDREFHVIVLDEAQNIKNSQAKRTKNLSLLRSHHRIALSGTPIENNLNELRSIFHFLMPGFLGSEKAFKDRYIGAEKEVLKRLSAKIRPFILRRTKEQVLKELPPKVEETIFLTMNDTQMKFYTTLKETYKKMVMKKIEEDGFQKSQFFVFEALMRLRQACLCPRLIADDKKTPSDSIKLTYLEENLEEIIDSWHTVLIFSQFPSFLSFVRTLLDRKNRAYNYLDGSTKNRQELVESFNTGAVKIFLISLKAGGTGLNLVSADYVIHLDPWWNPAVENQATDRAHRIGQTKTVFVQKLIVRDTIEEKVLELQNSKKRLVDDVFSGDFTGRFDEKDLKKIFE